MSFLTSDVVRRARAARMVILLAFLFLGAGFYRAQVLRHTEYVTQSEENRLREIPLPAARGIIYDRNGKVIAENLPGYTVSILAPSADSLRSALRRLQEIVNDSTRGIIPLSDDDIEIAVKRFNRAPNRPAVVLADALFQPVSILEEHRSEFPGLIIQSTPKRWYPDAAAVAPFVGYTGEISEAELANPSFDGYKAGMRVGKRGLEEQYESTLRGREGYRFVEVDARGRVVREAGAREDQAPVPGPDLQTNIDLDLQRFVMRYFADSLQGAVVALDPKTGGVLALYSGPSYDPNRFTGGIPRSYWDSLNTNPKRPLYNKAVQGRYPPASTFKLATAVLGLQSGVVKLTDHMPQPCTGGFTFGRYWRCWNKHGHGDLTLERAIETSCDVYFYQLGLKIGLRNLVAGGVSLKFGDRSGIDLPSETKPEFPYALDYYKRKFPRGFVPASEALNVAIGQGSDAQTVVNMAKFYTALANDGVMVQPSVARRVTPRQRVFQLASADMEGVRNALAGVLERGTARSAQLQGVAIAGKTGTAQNPPNPDHAWFVGFAPADDPKIVVAVFLEYGLHGDHAARVASKVIEAYLKKPMIASDAVVQGE
ncbi:penicillin-binding protein 2 [Gemmatimonadetes bacterium T265]|nr:penicillin-binding protein 2 [Gemmatimonadetes bacterium T265]